MKKELLQCLCGITLSLTASAALAQDINESLSVKSDVTLRTDQADKSFPTNGALEMYTERNDDGSIKTDFVGLMSFQIPVKDGYSVKSANLKLVTERAKGDIAIYAFDADVSDADTYNSQKANIEAARSQTPLIVKRLNGTSGKATFDGGASSNLEDWINNYDLTDYAQSLSSGKFNLLLVNNANSTPVSIQVYTSDAQDVTNERVTPNFTFKAEDLKPVLTVVYEKDEAQKVSTSTSTADTWVYRGNNGSYGSQDVVELCYQLNDDNTVDKEIDAMMSFQLPALALTPDYEIESVNLRLTTERVKGDRTVEVYGYQAFEENTNFANEESKIEAAKTADNLITSFSAKGSWQAMAYDPFTDEYKNVEAWTNNIDLTEYVKKQNSRDIHILLTKKPSSESIKFYTKDLQNDVTNPNFADLVFQKEDLVPQLTVVYKKNTSTGVEHVVVNVPSAKSDAVYSLQGVRMNSKNLPAGIYVKNGKKFVVK